MKVFDVNLVLSIQEDVLVAFVKPDIVTIGGDHYAFCIQHLDHRNLVVSLYYTFYPTIRLPHSPCMLLAVIHRISERVSCGQRLGNLFVPLQNRLDMIRSRLRSCLQVNENLLLCNLL